MKRQSGLVLPIFMDSPSNVAQSRFLFGLLDTPTREQCYAAKMKHLLRRRSLQAGFECSGGDQNAYLFQGDVARIAVKIVGHGPPSSGNLTTKNIGASMREASTCVNREKS